MYSQLSPQVEIYETSVQPLLSSLFKGYNATVLAYGQTGSGKTYTMGSGYLTLCNAAAAAAASDADAASVAGGIFDFDESGVIPRVLNDLFRTIEEEMRSNPGNKFVVRVSFLEVYNEEIKDLFGKFGTVAGFKFFQKDKKMGLVQLSTVEEAIIALIGTHNYQLAENMHLRCTFSKATI